MSVDLDEIHHYFRIHGLVAPPAVIEHVVYDVGLPRCLEFAREQALPLTFFCVSADLARVDNVAHVRRALAHGHELGSHSKDHLYDLVRRPQEEQREQVEGALRQFEAALSIRPQGFRAPGYAVSDQLLDIVRAAGHTYDSSVFPCPPYYAAKAAAMGLLWLRGRRSQAILDPPSVLGAPRRPYRIGKPYSHAGDGLWELPIQVTRGPRLPYIGTGLILGGRLGALALTELVLGEPFINLELHGIDFLSESDGLGALRGFQPDVSVSASDKFRVLSAVIRRLSSAGYRFVRLGEAVTEFAE
ncbi:MAG TPA: polysaccharide deacetylase family protein [Polyangiaceae bacterium]|nr:polysaccharide deacetylase family protein [Polyangiaceae bacterium]